MSLQVTPSGLPALAAAFGALDPVDAHQPLEAVAADVNPAPPEREVQLAVAEGLEVGLVHLPDDRQELLVGQRAGDRCPVARW